MDKDTRGSWEPDEPGPLTIRQWRRSLRAYQREAELEGRMAEPETAATDEDGWRGTLVSVLCMLVFALALVVALAGPMLAAR